MQLEMLRMDLCFQMRRNNLALTHALRAKLAIASHPRTDFVASHGWVPQNATQFDPTRAAPDWNCPARARFRSNRVENAPETGNEPASPAHRGDRGMQTQSCPQAAFQRVEECIQLRRLRKD